MKKENAINFILLTEKIEKLQNNNLFFGLESKFISSKLLDTIIYEFEYFHTKYKIEIFNYREDNILYFRLSVYNMQEFIWKEMKVCEYKNIYEIINFLEGLTNEIL